MGKQRRASVWDRYSIMAEVKRRGATLQDLSLKAGLSRSACQKALETPFLSGEVALSEFLGFPLNELWPDRYRTPISQRRSNALTASVASQKATPSTDKTARREAPAGATA